MTLQNALHTRKSAASSGSAEENSSSGVGRSSALGSGEEQTVIGDGRSAVPRDAPAQRRQKRTSKNSDVEVETRRSIPPPEAAGDVGPAVSDVRPSSKTSDLAVKQPKSGGSESRVLNGHADAPVAVTKDANAALLGGPRTADEGRRTFDADVLPLKTSHSKATTSPTTSGRDADHMVNGHHGAPVAVARDPSTTVTGGPRLSENQQVASLPVSIEHQTDIKPVNPNMAIFDVLNRQQVNKARSGAEDNNVQRSPDRHHRHHSNDIQPPTAVIGRYRYYYIDNS